jgi:transposase
MTSQKSNSRETRPKRKKSRPLIKSTEKERQDIVLFLRKRMNAEGALPPGTINEAAKYFGRNRHTIGGIYKELKPKSVHERPRGIPDHEWQDIVLFLRHRMNAGGLLPPGTINEAAQHFGRHRRTIERISKVLKPKSLKKRYITDQERQDIVLFLRHRTVAGGSLPPGTINEAAKHFGRHQRTIERISKELKPNSVQDRGAH